MDKTEQLGDARGFLGPRMIRIITNGKRLRQRISLSVLFVFIREIRGSNV